METTIDIITNILLVIIGGYFYYNFAENLTWKKSWGDKLRKKYPAFQNKPFNCTKCLSTWLLIFTLVLFNLEFNILTYALNFLFAFAYFSIVKYLSEKDDLKENNNNMIENNSKYKINKYTGMNSSGDDISYWLSIFSDDKQIVIAEFSCQKDREEYLKDWAKIFKK